MRILICFVALTFVSTAAFAEHNCPCVLDGPCCCGTACCCDIDYGAAWDRAVRFDRPLVVFVRQRAVQVPGCVCCRKDDYPGQSVPGVVLGLPDGKGDVLELARRDSYPTPEWIAARVKELQDARKKKDFAAVPYRPASPAFAPAARSGGC